MPGFQPPGHAGAGLAGYGGIVGPGLKYAGVDQGIDFLGSGPIYSLGDAVVTRVRAGGSGWPGQGAVVNYRIISGPGQGRYVYVAEDFTPSVREGQQIHAGDVIGQATGSGQAPGIEIGWAQPNGLPLAPRPAARPAQQYTPEGEAFRQFVVNEGPGAAPGLGGLASGVNSIARHIPGVAQVEDVGSFLGKLTDPHYILRGLQIVAGGVLVLVGVYLLARQIGLAADIPAPIPSLANQVPSCA